LQSCDGTGSFGFSGVAAQPHILANMETRSLDNTPHWIVYTVFVVFTAAFLFYVFAFIVQQLAARYYPKTPYRTKRGIFSIMFMAVGGGVVSWFLFSSMFIKFHAVVINPDRIELVYFWPRSHRVIETSALRGVNVIHYQRRGGYLEISTDQRVFRSVDFRQFTIADEIHDQLEARLKR
jgi:hypothetical protein